MSAHACVSICESVCVRERERERERQSDRERMSANACVSMCESVRERERERRRERKGERERESMRWCVCVRVCVYVCFSGVSLSVLCNSNLPPASPAPWSASEDGRRPSTSSRARRRHRQLPRRQAPHPSPLPLLDLLPQTHCSAGILLWQRAAPCAASLLTPSMLVCLYVDATQQTAV